MKGFKSTGFVLVGALTLAGCGGGGGDDPVELVTLNDQNASTAAGAAYYTASAAVETSAMGDMVLPVAVQESDNPRFVLGNFAKEQLDKLVNTKSQLTSNLVSAAAVYNDGGECSGGGTISFSWNDADNDSEFSPGDTFTFTFTNCVEAEGTINGSMTLTGFTLNEDPYTGSYSVGATYKFNNLRFTSVEGSFSVNGTYVFSFADNNVTVTINVSSNALTFGLTDASGSRTTTLRDYSATHTENISTWAYTFTSRGTIDDSRLNGRITFDTLTPFAGVNPGYPTAGVMKISGKNNSSVTLEAMSDGSTVRLHVDADGDGTAETFIDKYWVELDS